MPERAFEALKQISYFSELSAQVIADLSEIAWYRHFERGQVIYIEGEVADKIFVLETGWVRATRMTLKGREQALAFLRPGAIFGDIAVFIEDAYPASVIALEPADVWVIPAQDFLDLLKSHPELAMSVIRRLGKRVMYFIGLVEDLSLYSVEARLAHTLLHHAEAYDGKLIVPRRSWTTYDEMAVRLGTVRDVLSRGLKTLEAEGLLRVERKAIVLLDAEGLAKRGSS